jgi:hypothetical protein
MKVVALELRHPTCAVSPHTCEAQDLAFAHARAEEHRHDLEKTPVFFPYVLVRLGSRKPEGDVHALEQDVWDPDLITQLGERLIGARRASTPELCVPKREMPRGERGRNGDGIHALRVQPEHEAGAQ